ncbi:MAG: rhodanese-like domain-containing protein [Nitratireductor sp.]
MEYSGDKTCLETFEALTNDGSDSNATKAVLIDVRTMGEWEAIGVPALPENAIAPIFVEWQKSPTMMINPMFVKEVHAQLSDLGIGMNDSIYFLCRSGVRSMSAAAAMSGFGYNKTFNILDGYEGNPDSNGDRQKISGWVFDKLPIAEYASNKQQHE